MLPGECFGANLPIGFPIMLVLLPSSARTAGLIVR
jgi:hypothetical protein